MQLTLEFPDDIAVKLTQLDNPVAFISQLINAALGTTEKAPLIDEGGILVVDVQPLADLTNIVSQLREERILTNIAIENSPWPSAIRDLAGAWTDLPTAEEIRKSLGEDLPREPF
jgi:hypothetical protein